MIPDLTQTPHLIRHLPNGIVLMMPLQVVPVSYGSGHNTASVRKRRASR